MLKSSQPDKFCFVGIRTLMKSLTVGDLKTKFSQVIHDARYQNEEYIIDTHYLIYRLPTVKNKDSFDRMILWQAIENDLYLMTKDKQLTVDVQFLNVK